MFKSFLLELNISAVQTNYIFSVNSNDLNTIRLDLVVKDNTALVDLTGKIVRLAIRKPDHTVVFQSGGVTDGPGGKCEFILEKQAALVPGRHEGEVMIYEGDSTVAVTTKFYYEVKRAVLSNSDVESSSDFPAISQAIAAGEILKEIDIHSVIEAGAIAGGVQEEMNLAKQKEDGTLFGTVQERLNDADVKIESNAAELAEASKNIAVSLRESVSVWKYKYMADEDSGIWTRAFNAAHTEAGIGGIVFYPYGNYSINDAVLIHNTQTVYSMGLGTVTITQTGNAPIFASKNYYDGTGPAGRTKISGFRLVGDITKPLNHGILLRDYYSTITDCRVTDVGGDCYHLTTKNQSGIETSGTLVDNRLINCDAFRPVGHCFWIGEANNNKLTDGFMQNCYMSSSLTTPKHLYVGSSAGWIFNTIHTYGESTLISLEILNAFSTKLDNVYIEHFIDRGISFGSIQRDLQLSNVTIRCDDAKADGTGQAIYLSKSAAVTSSQISIAGITLRQNTDIAVDGINSASAAIDVSVVNYKLEQTFSNKIKRRAGVGADSVKMVTNALLEGSLRETADKSTMLYEGKAVALTSTTRLNGSGAKTATIPLPPITNNRKLIGQLKIHASAFDNGAKRATYITDVLVSAKTNGTNPWTVYTTDIIAPTGFLVNPVITVTNTGDVGELVVNFEYTNSDSQGAVSFIYSPATTV